MAGHVFITQGDLRRLACDAWLLPCDLTMRVDQVWGQNSPAQLQKLLAAHGKIHGAGDLDGSPLLGKPSKSQTTRARVSEIASWPEDEPRPWLVDVGGIRNTPLAWYAEGVRQFVKVASDELRGKTPLYRRARPLIGLPLVGTGQGGADKIKGEMIRTLLTVLYEAVATMDLDIVLITHTEAALAASLSMRRQLISDGAGSAAQVWSELTIDQQNQATILAEHAAHGNLVLFLGAGASVGAGLPTWDDLLLDLARTTQMTENEQTALDKLPGIDRARIIQGRLTSQSQKMGEIIGQRLSTDRYSLTHSILATLPIHEVATMNYDTLFESASQSVGQPVAVLPYQAAAAGQRWLLKMHGCITHPEDIVLTREDYLRYAEHRAALAGIVQALLITRHMLFVGFSLTDDNFHRIADDVRRAVRVPSATKGAIKPFGTALLLSDAPFMQELWQGDINFVNLGASPDSDFPSEELPLPSAAAARRLEIFLDLLHSNASSTTAHLLDPDFSGVLSTDEMNLKAVLKEVEALLLALPPGSQRLPASKALRSLLNKFGDGSEAH